MLLWKAGAIFRKWYLFVVREQYLDAAEMARIRVWYMREAGDVLKSQPMRSFKSFKEIALWWLIQNVQIFMGIRIPGSSKAVTHGYPPEGLETDVYIHHGARDWGLGVSDQRVLDTQRDQFDVLSGCTYFNGNLYSEFTLTMWSTILQFSFCFSLAFFPFFFLFLVISSGRMRKKA